MTTFLILVLVGFCLYKLGSTAAKHPSAAVGAGKVFLGLFKK